ncbi:DNA polymerase Y family protein [Clostridium sp. DL1XJH146]
MEDFKERIIFHIDVNSAFLSWEAARRLQYGDEVDLRDIPSAIGGDEKSRHGIILAKSIPAKKYGIKTGESLRDAFGKCPVLKIVRPDYDLYMRCSNAMMEMLKEYSPSIQRYSIDECFIEFISNDRGCRELLQVALEIKERIKKELGFTVNIGISNNKLLAKMASDFKKPDRVHTLFKYEIEEKMWPLKIEDLFMVGRATAPKLRKLNINTIGDLANYDLEILNYKFKKHGAIIWEYANGIDHSNVRECNYIGMKGLGNSTTISFDVVDAETAKMVLLSLVETLCMRLRDAEKICSVVSVSIRNNEFENYSHQRKLGYFTNSTREIYKIVKELFDEAWKGKPIRHLGVRVTELCNEETHQLSIFEKTDIEKDTKLDKTLDNLRLKYGKKAVVRSCFLNSGLKAVNGGNQEDDYPMMSSFL